jgi:hypothetical protein
MTIDQLSNLLLKHNINYQKWSSENGTKTIENLKQEIDEGETRLEIINNQVTRVTKIVSVDVKVKLGDKLFTLLEDKQIFITGAIRKRGLSKLSEKIQGDEFPELAAHRCLIEEIGLNCNKPLTFTGETEEMTISPSYPDLNSIYKVFNYQVILEKDDLEFIRFSEYNKQKGIISLFTLQL